MKKGAILLCAICFLVSILVSCTLVQDYDELKDIVFAEVSNNGRIKAFRAILPEKSQECVSESRVDGRYYVFSFYLGVLDKVPIYSSMSEEYLFDSETTFSFTSITEESFEKEISKSITHGVEVSQNLTAGVEVGLSDIVKLKTDVTWSQSFNATVENSQSYTDTYLTRFEKSFEKKYYLSEENGFEKGKCYRLTFYNILESYGILIYDSLTGNFDYSIQNFLQNDNLHLTWEISDDETFLYEENEIKLEFDVDSAVNYAEKNWERVKKDSAPENTVVNNEEILSNSNIIKVTNTGYLGLANRGEGGYDQLDLSAYSEYINKKDYLFCFEVKLTAKTIKALSSEIYLYSQNEGLTTDEKKLSYAIRNGFVCGTELEIIEGTNNHYLYWYVRGDRVAETMYIRYDATTLDSIKYINSSSNRHWTKNDIVVNLSVVTATKNNLDNTVCNNTNTIKVTDTGYFGLHERSDDKFNSVISGYKTLYNPTANATEDKVAVRNQKYFLVFDVELLMREINNGYQEIYLYSDVPQTTKEEVSVSTARKRGMLDRYVHEYGGTDNLTTAGTVEFTLQTLSENITDTMRIRYDAFGTDSDTWEKSGITVTVMVFEIPIPSYENNAKNIVNNAFDVYNGKMV